MRIEMMTGAIDPQLSRYSNRDLEVLLADPKLSEAQKNQVRQELTRRMRDDLIRHAQNVDEIPKQERRKQAWKMGKLSLLLIIVLLCILSTLCVILLARPDLLQRFFGYAPAFYVALCGARSAMCE